MNWRDRLRANPFGSMAAVAACLLGLLGALFGDMVSQGMTNSLRQSAPPVAHLWGVLFTTGGLVKLYGLYWSRSGWEVIGLWAMTGGYLFYAITVTAGLGLHGLAAGIISGALAIGCILKARLIMATARAVARAADLGNGGQDGRR